MLQQVKDFIQQKKLLDPKHKILVAVSGGIDSMVMLTMLHQLGYNLTIAHCNFALRGLESDGDAEFVENVAKNMQLPFVVKRFETRGFAKENGLSIQMAARELRYNWFHELAHQNQYDRVAVAHHMDDLNETFFINLLRGSGIHGLRSMQAQNGIIIRPLLCATAVKIRHFADREAVKWRDDSSNKEHKYLRNKIRHQLFPLLQHFNQTAVESISKSVAFLNEEAMLYDRLVAEKLHAIVIENEGVWVVEKKHFMSTEGGFQLLHEWLKCFGFSTAQNNDIYASLSNTPGTVFSSDTHCLTLGRSHIEITDHSQAKLQHKPVFIGPDTPEIVDPIKLTFQSFERVKSFVINRSEKTAQLDKRKLKFPLQLRPWKNGDRFTPIGMKGSKLLSDFFTDNHLSHFQKRQVMLLTDANDQILWVIGMRLDERFKVENDTVEILEICLLD